MKLEEIAEVMVGILAKRENNEKGENSYLLFSLKDYESKQEYEELKTNRDLSNRLAKRGDLLFRLIYPNKIIYVNDEIAGMLVPSQFCIIRAEKSRINPNFLKWYLESKVAKNDLEKNITGSIIKSMSITNLKTLEIPDITMKAQEDISRLIALWEEEKDISKKIFEEKEKLYDLYIMKMMEEGKKNGRKG